MQRKKKKNGNRSECKKCKNNRKCIFKSSVSNYEKKFRTKIECWTRRGDYSGPFGYHRVLAVPAKEGISVYFYHLFDELNDVKLEHFIKN